MPDAGVASPFSSAPDAGLFGTNYPPSTVTPSVPTRPPDYSTLFPTKEQMDKTQSQLVDLTKAKIDAEARVQGQFEKRDAENRAMMQRALKSEGAELNDLKPWDAQKEMSKRETPLWEQWGSPAVFASMLLSAFSHQPLTNSLNASAAAMNAIQKGDLDSYNRAMDAWKQNNELVQKRSEMEHRMYQDIDHLRERDMAEWRARATALAARFNDQRGLALLQGGMDAEFLQVKEAIPVAMARMAEAQDKIQSQQLKINMLNADPDWTSGDPTRMKKAMDRISAGQLTPEQEIWQQLDKERPNATYQEKLDALKGIKQAEYPYRTYGGPPTKEKEIAKVQQEIKDANPGISEADSYNKAAQQVEGAHKTLTPNEKLKQEAHIGQYDLALNDILPEAENILKHHIGAAGAAGYATRAAESVGNVLGSNETDRRQFESDIDELKLMAPSLLLDRATGRPLSAEHAYIDRIIRGLNIGDTTANTLRSLEELKRRLALLRDAAKERIPGSETKPPASAPATPPVSRSWDEFPEVK